MVEKRDSLNGDMDAFSKTQSDPPESVASADLVWLRGRMIANEALADARHRDVMALISEIKKQAPSIAEKRALIVALATVLCGVLAKFVGVDIPQLTP